MKCIKLLIDEDSRVMKVEDGGNDVLDEDFVSSGVVVKDDEEITYFHVGEDDDEDKPYYVYVLVSEEDYVEYMEDDGEFFIGAELEFYVRL